MRQSLNLRRNPLTRPQLGQRLYARVVNFGVLFTFNRSAKRDTVLRPPVRSDSVRNAHVFQERLAFVIGQGGGHNRDVHPVDGLHRIIFDFRKDQLLLQP